MLRRILSRCTPVSLRRNLSTSSVAKPKLTPLPRTYDARYVEARWHEWWAARGFFVPETQPADSTAEKDRFTIILPPPNVTGSLHLGHALTIAIEDALVRYHRMQGRRVLWLPGLDHAGIATQVLVEKDLWSRSKKTRHDVGREEFLQSAEMWKNEKSDRIKSQIRRLGASVDWNRLIFTLDEKIQRGVEEAFIQLFNRKKIYRQERFVNWCCHLQSTISDIEVEHRTIDSPQKIRVPSEKETVEVGYLCHFAFPVEDSAKGEEVVVATTRLETILGDTAVAVHPDDSRYAHLHGRFLRHPLLESTLPIILDTCVDPALGTGAVKITPAHDQKDFNIGLRHSLRSVRVIDDFGRIISPEISALNGFSRFEARKKIESFLVEKNFWRGRTAHSTVVPLCSRSGDIVEPQLKKQWFLQCEEFAEKATLAVKDGQLKIVPERFSKQWQQWLGENKDWCLSRQLWWGQRIPAYVTTLNGEEKWVAARSMEEARHLFEKVHGCVFGSSNEIRQDTDVFDTWFTSSMLPFLALGWPNLAGDFSKHYPLSLMETGHDILFFWVARMVMLGVALTDRLPFQKILLHGLVCDKNGKKMSKSVGNVIDPMEIICDVADEINTKNTKNKKGKGEGKVDVGADALRFALCRFETQQNFINVDLKDIQDANKFCNKIWQAFHLCSGVWDQFPPGNVLEITTVPAVAPINRWILDCLSQLVMNCNSAMEELTLDVAANNLHTFIYDFFCDVYLEATKPVLKEATDSTACLEISGTMLHCLDVCLRLISLFTPNLAEELYQRLPTGSVLAESVLAESVLAESVCVAEYPKQTDFTVPVDVCLQSDMRLILEISRFVKNLRVLNGLFKERAPLFVVFPDAVTNGRLDHLRDVLTVTSRSASVTFLGRDSTRETPVLAGCAFDVTAEGFRLYVDLKDRFNVEKERGILMARVEKINAEVEEKKVEIEGATAFRRTPSFLAEVAGLECRLAGLRDRLEELAHRSVEGAHRTPS